MLMLMSDFTLVYILLNIILFNIKCIIYYLSAGVKSR